MRFDNMRLSQVLFNLLEDSAKKMTTPENEVTVIMEYLKYAGHHLNLNDNLGFEIYSHPIPYGDDGVFEKNLNILKLGTQTHHEIYKDQDLKKLSQGEERTINLENQVIEGDGILKINIIDHCAVISKERIQFLLLNNNNKNNDLPHQFISNQEEENSLVKGQALLISKKICELMGGRLKIYQKEEGETVMTLLIPIRPFQEEILISTPSLPLLSMYPNGEELTALIVDDEPFARLVIKKFLGILNITSTLEAVDGLDAFKTYQKMIIQNKRRPIILTMDINMPVCNGKNAAQRVREFERLENIEPCFLIMISGNCSESEIKSCLDINGGIRAQDFLRKPLFLEDIRTSLTKLRFQQISA
jgi:CheY-like chemotaxis protein